MLKGRNIDNLSGHKQLKMKVIQHNHIRFPRMENLVCGTPITIKSGFQFTSKGNSRMGP